MSLIIELTDKLTLLRKGKSIFVSYTEEEQKLHDQIVAIKFTPMFEDVKIGDYMAVERFSRDYDFPEYKTCKVIRIFPIGEPPMDYIEGLKDTDGDLLSDEPFYLRVSQNVERFLLEDIKEPNSYIIVPNTISIQGMNLELRRAGQTESEFNTGKKRLIKEGII